MAITNDSSDQMNGSSSDSKIIPLEPIDQWIPIDNIRTFVFLVVREALNKEAMRDALDRLTRNHLPILGARLETLPEK